MKKTYTLNDCQVHVTFGEGMVHIYNDSAFWDFVDADPIESVALLVRQIKSEYLKYMGQALAVTDRSFVVEVWGHLYYEYYVLRLKCMLNARWFDRWSVKLLRPSASIDCGEKGKDRNRWLWDLLSGCSHIIARLLPKDIVSKGVKKQSTHFLMSALLFL